MSDAIIPFLRCPLTLEGLTRLPEGDLAALNDRARAGRLKHVSGARVEVAFDAALVTDDGALVYPVVDGIFVLLPGLAVVPAESEVTMATFGFSQESDTVMRFYDEIGWTQAPDGSYADAELFEDLRPVSADYIRRCHARVTDALPRSGTFMLDVASGPIQYEEYRAYSQGFTYRVCGDISLTALRAAREKIGDHGIYVQCDITRLPFTSGAIDAFTSLHTIYHVPASRQLLAFRELERVTAPGGRGVVVYSWGRHSALNTLLTLTPRSIASLLLPRKARLGIKRALRRMRGGEAPLGEFDELYFSPYSYRWFRRHVAAGSSWSVRVWRSVSVPFLTRYVHGSGGERLLRAIFALEESRPGLLGRLGQYPMLVYSKPR